MTEKSYTSEFVGNGHPDKICDQISDAILDECLKHDPDSRVAVETSIKAGKPNKKFFTHDDTLLESGKVIIDDGWVHLIGEITTKADINIERIVRSTISGIGYNGKNGFSPKNCLISTFITSQSSDISIGVTKTKDREQGAGDQGMMYGYAANENGVFMPLEYVIARSLVGRLKECREDKTLPFLRPDSKSQVTLSKNRYGEYNIKQITLAAQHSPKIKEGEVREILLDEVVRNVLEGSQISYDKNLDDITIINGTGRFVIGGPLGDSGVTGRKIIADSYGGRAKHGGGAYSGKDPSKVDRSAAYMARHVAKSIVHNGLANEIELHVAYTIGKSKPTGLSIDTLGTGKYPDRIILNVIEEKFDFRPGAIIDYLDLKKPIYLSTASGGHFGREAKNGYFPWEKTVDLS